MIPAVALGVVGAAAVARVRVATDVMATAMVVAVAAMGHVILTARARLRTRALRVPAAVLASRVAFPSKQHVIL